MSDYISYHEEVTEDSANPNDPISELAADLLLKERGIRSLILS
jgi:hypothetical protein